MIPGGVRIFVCLEPVDMRRGFDRMVQTARERGGHDPTEGGILIVFANRRATRVKLLWVERNGVCVLYERLHRARFELPLARSPFTSMALIWPSCSLVWIEMRHPLESDRAEQRGLTALRG